MKQSTQSCPDGMKYYEELVSVYSSCPTPNWILENRTPWWDGRQIIEFLDFQEHENGLGTKHALKICRRKFATCKICSYCKTWSIIFPLNTCRLKCNKAGLAYCYHCKNVIKQIEHKTTEMNQDHEDYIVIKEDYDDE